MHSSAAPPCCRACPHPVLMVNFWPQNINSPEWWGPVISQSCQCASLPQKWLEHQWVQYLCKCPCHSFGDCTSDSLLLGQEMLFKVRPDRQCLYQQKQLAFQNILQTRYLVLHFWSLSGADDNVCPRCFCFVFFASVSYVYIFWTAPFSFSPKCRMKWILPPAGEVAVAVVVFSCFFVMFFVFFLLWSMSPPSIANVEWNISFLVATWCLRHPGVCDSMLFSVPGCWWWMHTTVSFCKQRVAVHCVFITFLVRSESWTIDLLNRLRWTHSISMLTRQRPVYRVCLPWRPALHTWTMAVMEQLSGVPALHMASCPFCLIQTAVLLFSSLGQSNCAWSSMGHYPGQTCKLFLLSTYVFPSQMFASWPEL